jgi:hypothetical protein
MALGQLSTPRRARVELQNADQAAPTITESDDLGRFRITLPVAGSIPLRIERDPARASCGRDELDASLNPRSRFGLTCIRRTPRRS